MSGYTPLFNTLTRGTLCGKWPDIGLWPIILSLSDRNGVVDVTPSYISNITGLALDEVVACMKRFCEPDEYSRSQVEEGRRLVLLDEHRDWGWKIVNHAQYRTRARKQAWKARQAAAQGTEPLEDNDDEASNVPECPQVSPNVPQRPGASPTNIQTTNSKQQTTNSKENKNTLSRSATTRAPKKPLFDFEELKAVYPKRAGSQGWSRALKACNARLRDGEDWETILAGARRYRAFCDATDKTGTEFVKQAATFCGPDKSYLEPWELPSNKGQRRRDRNVGAIQTWLENSDGAKG